MGENREAGRTDPALEDLQGEEEWVEEEELARAAAGLPRHHVHRAVLAERDACVHPPPLVPVLHHHHQPLHPHILPRISIPVYFHQRSAALNMHIQRKFYLCSPAIFRHQEYTRACVMARPGVFGCRARLGAMFVVL